MKILEMIKDYWVLITCLLMPFLGLILNMIQATKCSLRNDILAIYDRALVRGKKISRYELEAIHHSAEIYFKLKGNSFVQAIVDDIKNFEITE